MWKAGLNNKYFSFPLIAPIIALISITFMMFKKTTLLECIVDVMANAAIPFLVLYIIVGVNGGV